MGRDIIKLIKMHYIVGWTWKCIASKFYFLQKLNFTTKRSWSVAQSRKWSVAIATISLMCMLSEIQRESLYASCCFFFLLLFIYILLRVKNDIKRCESKAPFSFVLTARGVSMNFVNVRQSCGIVLGLCKKLLRTSQLCAREYASVVHFYSESSEFFYF